MTEDPEGSAEPPSHGRSGQDDRVPEPLALDRLADDWIALWQSEIAGWMAEPELRRLLAAWFTGGGVDGAAGPTAAGGWPGIIPGPLVPPWLAETLRATGTRPQGYHPHGPASFSPAGPAPAGAAPGAGVAAGMDGAGGAATTLLALLLSRLDGVERRLAGFDAGAERGEAPARRSRRVRLRRR